MNNILIIVKELYCGGVERVAANLASELSEKYDVSVAYYHSSEQNHPVGEGYQVYQLGERDDGKQNPIYLMFFFAKLIPKLRRLKRELNIDLAFSMMPGLRTASELTETFSAPASITRSMSASDETPPPTAKGMCTAFATASTMPMSIGRPSADAVMS